MKKPKVKSFKLKNIEPKIKYEEKIKGFIDNVDNRIRNLKETREEFSEETKKNYDLQVEKLKDKRNELALKLKKVSDSNEQKWEEISEDVNEYYENLKDEVEVAYEGIKAGFHHLIKKLK